MKKILGLLLMIGGIVFGVWMGVWFMFIGGILQFLRGIQADPINSVYVVQGIARFLFSSAAGGLCCVLLIVPGHALLKN